MHSNVTGRQLTRWEAFLSVQSLLLCSSSSSFSIYGIGQQCPRLDLIQAVAKKTSLHLCGEYLRGKQRPVAGSSKSFRDDEEIQKQQRHQYTFSFPHCLAFSNCLPSCFCERPQTLHLFSSRLLTCSDCIRPPVCARLGAWAL